ncbi:hypothetical protein EVAR_27290_1 [Eumeta japonica]|uniref:Uncharacterized protein n=1 Tax=Eumeta variegata TaxID=151549 RepID=A0A4C1UD64_EUMVA|nr:hypothetical protein EVAR_27290_1 [Eumeta japonica]
MIPGLELISIVTKEKKICVHAGAAAGMNYPCEYQQESAEQRLPGQLILTEVRETSLNKLQTISGPSKNIAESCSMH